MRILQLMTLTVFSAVLAFGQVDAGTITGTVHDGSGAVIPGANITVESVGTGLKFEITTGAQGIYVSPPLRPQEYTVEVRVEGFDPAAKRFTLEVA